MQNSFKNLIFTNHALERLSQRGFTQDMVYEAFSNADRQGNSKNGGTEFVKKIGSQIVTVIAKQNEKYEWVVLSCWIDPPLAGTRDARLREEYKRYQKAGFWGKVWITVKRQVLGW